MRSVIVFARRDAHPPGGAPGPAALAARPAAPAASAAAGSRATIVPRDARGHFLVDARVDGRLINFMVDTGASVIALTVSDAARLGIHPAQRDFTVEVRTANGSVRAAPARLDKVEVGDLIVRDVAAVILPDGALSDNLLGLSFLSRLRRFEYSDGRLVLEQ
jgi:aspartyl protease family protein